MKRILMTGGGTAGHVTPNIALIRELTKMKYEIHYVGTKDGMEKEIIQREGIPYYEIHAGKLRRYFDFKNITDTFRITRGYFDSLSIIRKVKPNVLFSKGGFVSCPVVWAAWTKHIPTIIHESDMTPGLANKLSMPFAKDICYTFPETKKYIQNDKGVLTGIPVRQELLHGDKSHGFKLCEFNDLKPIILVIGGSLGAGILNKMTRECLNTLLKDFQICHVCGRGNIDEKVNDITGYKQFEYVNEELAHIFAMADLIVSRAGATTIFEILALNKPNLLIPLSKKASRGDQILNAESFRKQGFSDVIMEESLNRDVFINNIKELYINKDMYISNMKLANKANSTQRVIEILKKYL